MCIFFCPWKVKPMTAKFFYFCTNYSDRKTDKQWVVHYFPFNKHRHRPGSSFFISQLRWIIFHSPLFECNGSPFWCLLWEWDDRGEKEGWRVKRGGKMLRVTMKRWRTEERQKLQGWKRGVSRERETGNGERRWVCWCSSSHHLTVPHFNHHQFSPPISSGHASTSAAASGAAGAEETTAPMMPRCKHLNGNASFISTALVFLSAGKKKKKMDEEDGNAA